jgi:hypothetical protein
MISRRGLITGLVSLLAAPAIVRASSLDMLRGVKLVTDLTGHVPGLDYPYHEVTLGYTITRQAIENGMYEVALARLKQEGALIEYDPLQDTATVWGDPDLAGLLGRP